MVAALHAAGIEVLIDVVYNHTCEGGPDGPTLSFRGYRRAGVLPARRRRQHGRHHGLRQHAGRRRRRTVVRLVTDSLRYWADEMGVDGFRFDLASTMGRPGGGFFDRDSALLTAITTDPVLCRSQADRRAVGRDGRRLPGRRLRAAVGRVERPLPRHGP